MKPRVGISRCLIGDLVRYDGTHKQSMPVLMLGEHVEWIAVCPEVEIGMGVPREPIQLVARADGVRSADDRVRLMSVHSAEDWTTRMDRWASQRAADLRTLGISGFVLKARSPSCGPEGVLVHRDTAEPRATGRGLFAEALIDAMPGLPLADEESLGDAAARARFLKRVIDCARALTAPAPVAYSSIISSRSMSDSGLSGSRSSVSTSPRSSPRTASS